MQSQYQTKKMMRKWRRTYKEEIKEKKLNVIKKLGAVIATIGKILNR